MNSHSEYDDFAWLYNKHWGPYATQAITIIEELILGDLPIGAKILDLCCGTGQLAQELTSRGYKVIGVDVSSEMINFARLNAPEAEFIVQDAREFSVPDTYDCVVSTYDSLNFIMSEEELKEVFRNVYMSLKPGGRFLFDLNTEAGYLYHWDGGTFDVVEDDHVCVVRSSYDTEHDISQIDATIFRLLDGWQRIDLTFSQRCYSEVQVRDALQTIGFVETVVYGYHDDIGLGELTGQSERAYYVCKKP